MTVQSRRIFLKNGALAIAGTSLLSQSVFAAAGKKEITGIQLYSVRDDMKKDPSGTLQKLAAMGYVYVEHANYIDRKFYGYTAKEFRKLLDGYGLKMRSGHTKMSKEHWDPAKKDFSDSWKYTVEDAAVVGQQFVISPSLEEDMRNTYDVLLATLVIFNKSGELCKKSGMKFGYHNHDFEFSSLLNGKKVFDIIMQHTDPSLVAQQLDMGNLYNGGAKAIDIARQYPGRFELMHVKDEILSPTKGEDKYESTILGKGIVNTKAVMDLGRKEGGTYQFIIEQESYQGRAPLDTVKEDLAIVKKWGYAV